MYATVEQAEEYISNYYLTTDNLRISWEAMSSQDKQVLLNKSERTIDQLPFKGKSEIKGKAFPREPDKEYSLQKACEATIILALNSLNESDTQIRIALQNQGVKSYKIGDLSETFESVDASYGLDRWAYSIVFPVLREWLSGGFSIRPGERKHVLH